MSSSIVAIHLRFCLLPGEVNAWDTSNRDNIPFSSVKHSTNIAIIWVFPWIHSQPKLNCCSCFHRWWWEWTVFLQRLIVISARQPQISSSNRWLQFGRLIEALFRRGKLDGLLRNVYAQVEKFEGIPPHQVDRLQHWKGPPLPHIDWYSCDIPL